MSLLPVQEFTRPAYTTMYFIRLNQQASQQSPQNRHAISPTSLTIDTIDSVHGVGPVWHGEDVLIIACGASQSHTNPCSVSSVGVHPYALQLTGFSREHDSPPHQVL